MKLLQRVSALIRANISDLLDRAEDPEKMIKQLITDLNNQFIQVKTGVAQSLADLYLMEKRLAQAREEAESYRRKAEIAVDRGDDELARAALERHNAADDSAGEIARQVAEQTEEVEALKRALHQLETKIAEVTRQRDVLLARHRRAVTRETLARQRPKVRPEQLDDLVDSIYHYVDQAEATAHATVAVERESVQRRLAALEDTSRIDAQLAEMKARRAAAAAG